MSAGVQGSIFDLDAESPRLRELGSHVERRVLTKGAWVDLRPGWIAGSTDLFDALRDDVPWRAERRRMYDRVVDVPRLVRNYQASDELPDPLLVDARAALTAASICSDASGEPPGEETRKTMAFTSLSSMAS